MAFYFKIYKLNFVLNVLKTFHFVTWREWVASDKSFTIELTKISLT